MEDQALFEELKLMFEKLGVELREQALESDAGRAKSGMTSVYSQKIFYLDQALELGGKIKVMIAALAGFDLSGVFVSPYLRSRIEEVNEKKA